MLLLAAIAGLSLAACTPSSGFEQRMQEKYVRKSADQYTSTAGNPHRTQRNDDGSRVLTWEFVRRIDGLYGTQYVECVVNLTVAPDGIISRYTARGSDCRT